MDFIDLPHSFSNSYVSWTIFSYTYHASRFYYTTILHPLLRSRDTDSAPSCDGPRSFRHVYLLSNSTFFIISYNTDKWTIWDTGLSLSIVYIYHHSFLWTLNGQFLRGLRHIVPPSPTNTRTQIVSLVIPFI